jgi:hypothetical protein
MSAAISADLDNDGHIDGEVAAVASWARSASAAKVKERLGNELDKGNLRNVAAVIANGRIDGRTFDSIQASMNPDLPALLPYSSCLTPLRAGRLQAQALSRIEPRGLAGPHLSDNLYCRPAVHTLAALKAVGRLRHAQAARTLMKWAKSANTVWTDAYTVSALLRVAEPDFVAKELSVLYERFSQFGHIQIMPFKGPLAIQFALHPAATSEVRLDVLDRDTERAWVMAREPVVRADRRVRQALLGVGDAPIIRLLMEDAAEEEMDSLFRRYVEMDAAGALLSLYEKPRIARNVNPTSVAPLFEHEDKHVRQRAFAAISLIMGEESTPLRGPDPAHGDSPTILGPANRPSLDPRRVRRAMALLALPISATEYRVIGGEEEHYTEAAEQQYFCDCMDFRRGVCKHLISVLLAKGDAEAIAKRDAERQNPVPVQGSFYKERKAASKPKR